MRSDYRDWDYQDMLDEKEGKMEDEIELPKPCSLWQHKNGCIYRVIGITNLDRGKEQYPTTVVYAGVANNKKWSRPFSTWHASMTEIDGIVVLTKERFKELDETESFMLCLEAAGVDNWDGYGEAREKMAEEYGD